MPCLSTHKQIMLCIIEYFVLKVCNMWYKMDKLQKLCYYKKLDTKGLPCKSFYEIFRMGKFLDTEVEVTRGC